MMLSIGQLAQVTSEGVKTLRYWSDQGLLNAERGANGYRYYDQAMANRVAFIRRTQALGFSLEEIRGVLSLRDEGLRPCDEVRIELEEHLLAVRAKLAELQALEVELSTRLAWAKANPDPECEEGCVYLTDEPE